ncbi:expressed unknown protein [Seminavis robusta]|uniref:Uncharacterized protein n=2 Tax=Seminavis robusta TaxID=568900 RepID=A0A9N8EF66_9STRA|nr:expressed unknown protein [Seminavis robusta]|eukprot:Sro1033_g233780.1 n/a (152) ;mRNA; f:38954-39409
MYFLLGWLPKNTIGYEFAQVTYIPANLLFCGLWFFEASLWMIFDEDEPAWHKLGEVVLSVFFVLDGIMWVYGWLFLEEPLANKELLIYTAIDFAIYLFYLVLAIRAEAKATHEALLAQQKAQDLEAAAAAGNVLPPSDQPQETETDFKLMT